VGQNVALMGLWLDGSAVSKMAGGGKLRSIMGAGIANRLSICARDGPERNDAIHSLVVGFHLKSLMKDSLREGYDPDCLLLPSPANALRR